MATYVQQTTSNGVAITNNNAVQAILEDYEFLHGHGLLHLTIPGDQDTEDTDQFHVYGEAPFHPHPPVEDLDHPDDVHHEPRQRELLERLAPHLDGTLVIQTIGRTKNRFPFTAHEWVATPAGRVHHTTFTHGKLPDEPATAAAHAESHP